MSNVHRSGPERPAGSEPTPFDTPQYDEQTTEFDVAAGFEEPEDAGDEPQADGATAHARQSLAGAADRIGRWFAGLDRRPEFDPEQVGSGPVAELPLAPAPEPGAAPSPPPASPPAESEPARSNDGPARFALAPLGYNRQAVDEHLAQLERDLAQLRERVGSPISINEEIERLGEQTASILVVAHDKAHETTRIAQEQAERCIADAASNAVEITAEAKQRLRELDEETDAVWRERERLLEDVRTVSGSLATLADEAAERFPADRAQDASGVTIQG